MTFDARQGAKILIADSDPNLRLVLARAFAAEGLPVRTTGPAATLLKWIADPEVSVVVLDGGRAEDEAHLVLRRIRAVRPDVAIILTGRSRSLESAVAAADAGAQDYLPKPYGPEELVDLSRRAALRLAESDAVKAQARARRTDRSRIVGASPAMQSLFRPLARIIGSDLPVLIQGEAGSGKTTLARMVHALGDRRERPLVILRVAALSPEEIDSRLFGERLAEADGGVLVLQDVADLGPRHQARLISLLDGVDPVISAATGRAVNVRIVATAGSDLAARVRAGQFRADLQLRLRAAAVKVPPLRDRPTDVSELANVFLSRGVGSPKALSPAAVRVLEAHDWPGNARELEALMDRLRLVHIGAVIDAETVETELGVRQSLPGVAAEGPDLADAVEHTFATILAGEGRSAASDLYDQVIGAAESALLRATLASTRGNKFKAAELLGINRNTLRRKLHDLGVEAAGSVATRPSEAGRVAA